MDNLALFFESRETRRERLPEKARIKLDEHLAGASDPELEDRLFATEWLSMRTGLSKADVREHFDITAARFFGIGLSPAQVYDKIAETYRESYQGTATTNAPTQSQTQTVGEGTAAQPKPTQPSGKTDWTAWAANLGTQAQQPNYGNKGSFLYGVSQGSRTLLASAVSQTQVSIGGSFAFASGGLHAATSSQREADWHPEDREFGKLLQEKTALLRKGSDARFPLDADSLPDLTLSQQHRIDQIDDRLAQLLDSRHQRQQAKLAEFANSPAAKGIDWLRRHAELWYSTSEKIHDLFKVDPAFRQTTIGQANELAGSAVAFIALAMLSGGVTALGARAGAAVTARTASASAMGKEATKAVAGILQAAGTASGSSPMFSAFYGQVETERMAHAAENDQAYDPYEAFAENLANAGGQFILERAFGVERLLDAAWKDVPKLAGGKVPLGYYLKQIGRKATQSAIEEGLTEPAQGLWNDVNARLTYDAKRELVTKEAGKQRAIEAVIGFGLGGFFGGAIGAFSAVDQARLTGFTRSSPNAQSRLLTAPAGDLMTSADFHALRKSKTDSQLMKASPDIETGQQLIAAVNGSEEARRAYNAKVIDAYFINTNGMQAGDFTIAEVTDAQGNVVPAVKLGDSPAFIPDFTNPKERAWFEALKSYAAEHPEQALAQARATTTVDSVEPAPTDTEQASATPQTAQDSSSAPAPTLRTLVGKLRRARGSNQATTAAQDFLRKPLTNTETGITAVVSGESFKKILSESSVKNSVSQQAHHEAAGNVDILFALAAHRRTKPDRNNNPDIKAIHHFNAPMPFDGQILEVSMMVKEYTRPQHGNALYTLSALEIGKAAEAGKKVDRSSKDAAPDGEYTPERGSGSTVLDGFHEKFASMVSEVKAGMADAKAKAEQTARDRLEFETTGIPQTRAQQLELELAQILSARADRLAVDITRYSIRTTERDEDGNPIGPKDGFKIWGLDKFIRPISARLAEINPQIAQRLRRFEFDTGIAINASNARVTPFLESIKVLKKKNATDAQALHIALINADTRTRDALLNKHGLADAYREVSAALTDIYTRTQAAGIDIGFLPDYFPRKVADLKALRKAYGTDLGGQIEQALADAKRKAHAVGRTHLSAEEEVAVINNAIKGRRTVAGDGKPSHAKSRTTETVGPEAYPHYAGLEETLLGYIHRLETSIATAHFFGKNLTLSANERTGTTTANLSESIGSYVNELIASKAITADQQAELTDILQARFNFQPSSKPLRRYRNLTQITLVGQYSSTLRQLTDQVFSAKESGWLNTLIAATSTIRHRGKNRITLEEIGVETLAKEFQDPESLRKGVHKVFKKTFFDKFDRLGKLTLIDAKRRQIMRRAKRNGGQVDPRTEQRVRDSYNEADAARVIDELARGELTADSLFIYYTTIADWQPISLSEYPEKYLDSPNGRIAYTLQSFTIKMIESLRREGLSKIVNGIRRRDIKLIREGILGLMHLAAALVLADTGVDVILKLFAQEPVEFEDQVIENLWRLVGLNRWTVERFAKTGDPKHLLSDVILPPASPFSYPAGDISNAIRTGDIAFDRFDSVRLIPIFGKPIYHIFGAGKRKREEKQRKAQAEYYRRLNAAY